MLKTIVLVLVAFGLGVWGGGYSMQQAIAAKFSQGEGRSICEAILSGVK